MFRCFFKKYCLVNFLCIIYYEMVVLSNTTLTTNANAKFISTTLNQNTREAIHKMQFTNHLNCKYVISFHF